MRQFIVTLLLSFFLIPDSGAQSYPYPVKYITVNIDGIAARMAYMEAKPENPNGRAVLLLHGKNFTGYYWKEAMASLAGSGYRVIAPDQVGWGLSTKPDTKYTFEMLAHNNLLLLDSLHIAKVNVLGHSMGGMLAIRFALQYPARTETLLLEDPLGLEDYKKFIPYRSMEQLYKKEMSATYESYKKYQQSYYPSWKPEYEQYVAAQAAPLQQKDFAAVAWVYALTYQMIYEQPVVDEINNLKMPVMLMVGARDRTYIGRETLPAKKQKLYGNMPALAKNFAAKVKGSKMVILQGIGHIPHIQDIARFNRLVLDFLAQNKAS